MIILKLRFIINVVLPVYFCGNWYIYFMIIWWIECLKEQHLFEVEIFCNILNIFNVTLN